MVRTTALGECVVFSYWTFATWWILILSVHVLTCGYTALYAYGYWELHNTFANTLLYTYRIGMPTPYHRIIAIVHAVMSAVHGTCILLMVGGSVKQRSLAFTPWASCLVTTRDELNQSRVSSVVLREMAGIYQKITNPCGVCGVRGRYFLAVYLCREIVETVLQTFQAYRMSMLLSWTLLNRFYVILLVINCWSSVVVNTVFFRHDEARRRFAGIVLDCILDLMACMGVEFIISLSYIKEYDPDIRGFNGVLWYHDEWMAKAYNEFQMIVVTSWGDLASRVIFSLGLIFTTINLKKLMYRIPRIGNHISQCPTIHVLAVDKKKLSATTFNPVAPAPKLPAPKSRFSVLGQQPADLLKRVGTGRYNDIRPRTTCGRLLLRIIHLSFGGLGFVLLALHIHAALQPTLPQCLLQVKPWAVSRPYCYLVGLDCHTLHISGQKDEVLSKWSEFDSMSAVQLLIRHCPKLQFPDVFRDFHQLRGIKMYNTTIDEWGESAAITNTDHPRMTTLFFARVNMTGGLLPAGLQATDFPQNLYDIELCVSNLRELPDNLDTKWLPNSVILLEYGLLTTIPAALIRLEPNYLFVTGNPIEELPPEIFSTPEMYALSISNTKIRELPRNVTLWSPMLHRVFILDTDISSFWFWVDEVIEQNNEVPTWVAGRSIYCNDLEKILNGTANAFQVPLSPEYSAILMDPSEANWPRIFRAVDCDIAVDPLFYPLSFEDSINAISTPPEFVKIVPRTRLVTDVMYPTSN